MAYAPDGTANYGGNYHTHSAYQARNFFSSSLEIEQHHAKADAVHDNKKSSLIEQAANAEYDTFGQSDIPSDVFPAGIHVYCGPKIST